MHIKSGLEPKPINLSTTIMLVLGFWLGAIILLDWVIMPSLYLSGMMTTDSFATAGYGIFWVFNRLELIAAGLAVSGCLGLASSFKAFRWQVFTVITLFAIALLDTYFLTPQMSAIAINLNPLSNAVQIPTGMDLLHGCYWGLEIVKLTLLGLLLNAFWPIITNKNLVQEH